MAAALSGEANIRNGLRFFDRTDELTASKVGIAAREGNVEALRALLVDGKYRLKAKGSGFFVSLGFSLD